MLPFFKILGITIYTYPMLMGIAWGVAYHVMTNDLSKLDIKFKYIIFFFLGLLVTSWIGAKVFFIFSTQGISTDEFIFKSNFWLGGGFVFYGGLIFGILFLILFQYFNRLSIDFYNTLIPALCFGHAIGRIGCFLAGCCYGIATDSFIGVHMHGVERIPVQIFESIALIFLGFIFQKKIRDRYLLLMYLGAYSLVRFCLEFMRGDKIRGVWVYHMSTSQIISLVIGLLTISIYFIKISTKKKINSKRIYEE